MKSKHNFAENPELQSVLEKKFSQLNPENNLAPEDLKGEVFDTLNSMLLLGDLVDLFTVKFARTELNFLDPTIPGEWEEED